MDTGTGTEAQGTGTNDNANTSGQSVDTFKPITSEAELAQYKADLRKNIAKDLRESIAADLKAEADRKTADDKKKRDDDDAKAKGDFEKVENGLRTDLEAARNDATSLKAENDQLRAAIATVLEAEWKDLPSEVKDVYLGADDDPLAKLAFLPKGKTLAAKLGGSERVAGNRRDPKVAASSNGKPDATQIANEMRRAMGLPVAS